MKSFAMALLVVCLVPLHLQAAERPNIVFILADDLGWAELGCYGNDFNETPHIDALAAEGMRFTQAYAAAPVCSPYRAALLTGLHPARVGITDYLRPNSANALSTSYTTLAEHFQQAGYATGMVGKWHLSGYERHQAEYEIKPADHGFAWDVARPLKGVANGVNFWPYVEAKPDAIRWLDLPENRLGENEYVVDRMNREAVEFIERNKDRPFLLYLSHYATHSIVNGKPALVEKYIAKHAPGKSTRENCYLCRNAGHTGDPLHHWAGDHNPHLAAMLESIDDGVGLISSKLKELDLADNTIFIFTSDNGGETNVTSNAPLRGGKSQLYEGGIRVPMIVRWPGNTPAGVVCRQPTMNTDFCPTLLAAADLPGKTKTFDGVSTLAAWRDPAVAPPRDALYWHYPLDRPHFLGGVSAGAIRKGDWKLIEFFDTGGVELYSLADDPSETKNLADVEPRRVAELKRQLADWRKKVSARSPSPPFLTETRQLYFGDHFSSNRASEQWWFNQDWVARNDMLIRGEGGDETTRIFLRDVAYGDCMVRFDFKLNESNDLRLVTGSGGHYNAVVHIRPDHFYLQTAKDESVPYFSYRHGECAFEFDRNRWYTMTVEFLGDELVAHIDPEHTAYAKHPIIDRERTYFAFQVDELPAAIDNVLIYHVKPAAELAKNRAMIESQAGRHPVPKTITQQYDIRKTNNHERFYQQRPEYRALVKRVDDYDEQLKQQYPAAFASLKEAKKKILELRKQHNENDNAYREVLHATHRANRAIDAWLFAQQPGSVDLPDSQRRRTLELLRRKHEKDAEYVALVNAAATAQKKLEKAYPQLYVADEELVAGRKRAYDALKSNEAFRTLKDKRAEAYYAQQDYLFVHDERLAELKAQWDANK